MVTDLAAFLAVSAVVIVTPGQDTALTIRNTLLGGRSGGVFTALGVSAGQATWTVATSAGISAVLLASEPLFAAVKLLGAAYLVFLGAQALRDAFSSRSSPASGDVGCSHRPLAASSALRQGLLSNLGNPKMAVFFTSLLPQFAAPGGAAFLPLLALGLVFSSLTLVWLTAYAVAVAKAGDLLRGSRVRRALEGVTGAVLVAVGLRVAAAHP